MSEHEPATHGRGQGGDRGPRSSAAASDHLDTRTAAIEVADRLHDGLGGPCDLLVVFATFHHTAALDAAMETLRTTLSPGTSIALTTESVVTSGRSLEGSPGLAAIAISLPGCTITPWLGTPDDPVPISRPEAIPERLGLRHDTRAMFMFGDPFSTPITRLLPALNEQANGLPILGGMASGASQPNHNALVLDDRMVQAGVIGATISGPVRIDAIVSQGCRPIGSTMVVTKMKDHLLLELGGRPVFEVLESLGESMPERERALLAKGLLIGHVVDERRRPFGRGDFLVRSIVGMDRKRRGLTVADRLRPGQTVQFHARDAVTASEDLQLLLDAQQLDERPFGALLFTCSGRGGRLFDDKDHDAAIIEERLGPLPLAGFLAAGEVGPLGGRSFLHGHTAVLTLFREADPQSAREAAAEAAADAELGADAAPEEAPAQPPLVDPSAMPDPGIVPPGMPPTSPPTPAPLTPPAPLAPPDVPLAPPGPPGPDEPRPEPEPPATPLP